VLTRLTKKVALHLCSHKAFDHTVGPPDYMLDKL